MNEQPKQEITAADIVEVVENICTRIDKILNEETTNQTEDGTTQTVWQ
jgi:hypothetical protein